LNRKLIWVGILPLLTIWLASDSYAFQPKILSQLDSLTARIWTLEDGLPVNTVNKVAQDDQGYIWLTTYDGLVRFDGLEFKVYNFSNTPQMLNNRTTQIYIQRNVGVWVALEHGGVLLKKGEEFDYFGVNEGFTNSDITKIFEDKNGRIFFVTLEGLFVYHENNFRKFYVGNDILQNQISDAYVDPKDGAVWLSTHNGLAHIVEDEITFYNVSDSPSDNLVRGVIRDEEGVLIAGSKDGVYELINHKLVPSTKYKLFKGHEVINFYIDEFSKLVNTSVGLFLEEDGEFININGGYSNNNNIYVYEFFRDSQGTLWMPNSRGELYILKNNEFKAFEGVNQLQGFTYSTVFEDSERNIWLGSFQQGIIRLRNSNIRTYGVQEGLSGGNILGLLEDTKGRFWVGTRGEGLNIIDGDKIKKYRVGKGIKTNIVQTIAEDSSGNVWVGHYQKGLDRFTDGKIQHFDFSEDYEKNDIHALFVGSDGMLWAGTYSGLVRFNSSFTNHKWFSKKDGMSGQKIRYITQGGDGSIWAASLEGGVSRLKDGKFTNYTVNEGLSSNNIRSIYIDEDEVVWVGTENNGLNRIKDGKIDHVSTDQGLPDYNIHWISDDENGFLWISTNRGVCRIDKRELNLYMEGELNEFQITQFGRAEGMRSPEGNGSFQEAGIKTKSGTFWIATQDGVSIINNKTTQGSISFPPVIIESIASRDSLYTVNEDVVVIEKGEDDLQVKFHAITFINPEKTKFRYKLVGHHDNWVVTNERVISFTQLAPDTYKFLVQATNNDGVWSTDTTSVNIRIQPRFSQSIMFYVIIAVLLAIIYYITLRFRYRILISRQQKMQAIINTQTQQLREEKNALEEQHKIIEKQAKHLEEVNKTKDKFFSIIAHDLRNPFQAMLGFSDLLYSRIENIDKEELKEGIAIIRDSSKTLHSLTENLLHWATLQTGQVTPKPAVFLLQEIISKNLELYFQLSRQKDISLIVEADETIIVDADKDMIDTVIRNLISNAIKFTKPGGKVSITTFKEGNFCKIEIADNGIGMSKDIISGIMNLDSKAKRIGTNNETGTGLGLVLCNEMVSMNGGDLSIDSTEGKGTTFTVTLPLTF